MKERSIFLIFFLSSIFLNGQSLAVTEIADSLKLSAQAVVRYDSSIFTVKTLAETELRHSYAITILKPQMKHLAEIALDYDKFSSVNLINASAYDANGLLLKKLKPKDISDNSGTSRGTMISDERFLYADLRQNFYPYTIVVTYKKSYLGSMFYPNWYAVSEANISVEKAFLACKYPPNLQIRYQERNIQLKDSTQGETFSRLVWSIENLKSMTDESYSVGLSSIIPQVMLAPSKFKMNDYEGDMTSWKAYGEWVNKLIEGRDVLLESDILAIKSLTAELKTNEEKIHKVYEYMQANSRYVAIQLGIGGWQPFDASFVGEKKYGDCKALSNYTKALLSSIGISSNYTLVRAATISNMNLDFPNARFNHAILCVPNEGDTIWLECTSQTNPIGYMGTHTGNRHALLVNESGGQVVRTPYYSAQKSLESKSGEISLKEDGNSELTISIRFTGIQIENEGFENTVYAKNAEEKEKWIREYFDLNAMKIDTFNMQLKEHPLKDPIGEISVKFTAREIEKISGNRIMFNPNLYSQFPSIKFQKEPRKTDIEIRFGYSEADTLLWKVPPKFNTELTPKDVRFESKFGTYSRSIRETENGFIYVRNFSLSSGTYPKSEYGDFVGFLKAVIRSDGESIVLINQT